MITNEYEAQNKQNGIERNFTWVLTGGDEI